MGANYYFISSPLHLLFSLGFALRNAAEPNVVVLVPQTLQQANDLYSMVSGSRIFSELVSFHDGWNSNKLKERRRRMRILKGLVAQQQPHRIYTGNDRRIEFQYTMHRATSLYGKVDGIYLDEGMATYLGHKSEKSLAHRYIDPFFKKLMYGLWWNNAIIIGASKWISEIYAVFPQLVHPYLREKRIKGIPGDLFAAHELTAFSEDLLERKGMIDIRFDEIGCLVLLTHDSFYRDPEAHLAAIMTQLQTRFEPHQISVKLHPRSTMLESYRELFPEVQYLPLEVGIEFLLAKLPQGCLYIGDISSALFTIKWFNPAATILSLKLDFDFAEHIGNKLLQFFRQMEIPLLERERLSEYLPVSVNCPSLGHADCVAVPAHCVKESDQ